MADLTFMLFWTRAIMMEQYTSNTYGDNLSFFNGRPTAIVKTRKRPLVISVNIHGAPDLK